MRASFIKKGWRAFCLSFNFGAVRVVPYELPRYFADSNHVEHGGSGRVDRAGIGIDLIGRCAMDSDRAGELAYRRARPRGGL